MQFLRILKFYSIFFVLQWNIFLLGTDFFQLPLIEQCVIKHNGDIFPIKDAESSPLVQSMLEKGNPDEVYITVENPLFKSFVFDLVKNALEQGTEYSLSNGLLRCYEQLLQDKNEFSLVDLKEAMPDLLGRADSMQLKASRPPLPYPIVGPGTCDLSTVNNMLSQIQTQIAQCCNNIFLDFQGTYSTITACCNNITSEFQQTWTILGVIQTDLSEVLVELSTILAISIDTNTKVTALEAAVTTIEIIVVGLETTVANIQSTVNQIQSTVNGLACWDACFDPVCYGLCSF